ncbi:MAG TPA: DUF1320 domain-containing protein [Methylocystis sp.]|jgi:phage gp36-like protein
MPYATSADLDTKWTAEAVTLAAYNGQADARDADRVAMALDNASALIDGYLAKRYSLPIDPSPVGARLLRNLCCDLAMGELATTPMTRNDIVIEAVKAARDFLAQLGQGKADIPQNPSPDGGAGGAVPAVISPNEAIVEANDRMFTRNRLRRM